MRALLLIAALDLSTIAAEIDQANVRGDRGGIEVSRIALRKALAGAAGGEALDYRYALAYADYRLAMFSERGGDERKRYLEDAEAELERLLEERPSDAEAQALYATVNGNLITGMWSGMRRGPRADEAFERARKLAPENPRVAMLEGVSRLFRPGFTGGGVDKAEKELTRALQLFAKEPPDSPWPNWGRAEIHAWLGVASTKRKDYRAARAHLETAVSLEPEYAWVKETLLPELKAAEDAERD